MNLKSALRFTTIKKQATAEVTVDRVIFIIKKTLLASILCAVSCWVYFSHLLPARWEILPELLREPIQKATTALPFDIEKEGTVYHLVPRFDYEINGLVATDGASIFYPTVDDAANKRDLGLVWGKFIESGAYKKATFDNQFYSLHWQLHGAKTQDDYNRVASSFSNNHLIAQDRAIEKRMMGLRRGDQVSVKGYLVNYTLKGWTSYRSTSTVRDDTGCEIIFVKELKVLKRTFWRHLFGLSIILAGLCVVTYAILFFREMYRGRDIKMENSES